MSRSPALVLALVSIASVAHADTARVETGERIYGEYCSNCHGDGLRNTSGGLVFDLRRLRAEDHQRFLKAVLDGTRQMPAWRARRAGT